MIHIITDSTSDLNAEQAKGLGVEIIPLPVHFGEECYLDGVDITKEEFYEKLSKTEKLPTTSQINPDAFVQRFQPHVDAGDSVVGIFLSSKLSGTCQSAMIARTMVNPERIFVVDSNTVTFALGLLVAEAAALRDQGRSAEEISEAMEKLSQRVRLVAMVDTLKYLKMGGRISAATAAMGGLLGINPMVAVAESGTVEAVGKVRGKKAAFRWMSEYLKREPMDPNYRVAFGHTNAPAVMEECIEALSEQVDTARAFRGSIGAVVGTHVGPGAAGIAYIHALT